MAMIQHPYHSSNNEDESTLGSRSYVEGTIDYGDDDGQSLTNDNNNNMTMQPTSPQLPRIFNAGLQLQSLLRSEMSGNVSFLLWLVVGCCFIFFNVRLIKPLHKYIT